MNGNGFGLKRNRIRISIYDVLPGLDFYLYNTKYLTINIAESFGSAAPGLREVGLYSQTAV